MAKRCYYTVLEGTRTSSWPTALNIFVYDTVRRKDLHLTLWVLVSPDLLFRRAVVTVWGDPCEVVVPGCSGAVV